jgi:hypothetical protein
MGEWVDSVESFRDFISVVVVHAPDEFPVEDYLRPDEQLNLEKAFAELRDGLKILINAGQNAAPAGELFELLSKSLVAYRFGKDVEGAHLLQDFEAKAFR